MFKQKSFVRSILTATLFAQTLVAGVASAEQLPADPYASPQPGEQHPGDTPPEESDLPTTGPLEARRDRDVWYGNSYWGGGYRFYEDVRAPSLTFQSVNADFQARARLFTKQMTVFDVSTGTWNPRDNFRSARLTVSMADKEIFDETKSSDAQISTVSVPYNLPTIDKTAFSMSKSFGLGPININVSGGVHVVARAGLNATAYRTAPTTSGATFTGNVFARSYGSLSGGADVWLASGGVRGNVDFVRLDANLSLKSERSGNNVNYDTNFRVNMCSLSGDVEIYGSFLGFSGEKTILDWDGVCINRDWGLGRGTTYMGPVRAFEPLPIFDRAG